MTDRTNRTFTADITGALHLAIDGPAQIRVTVADDVERATITATGPTDLLDAVTATTTGTTWAIDLPTPDLGGVVYSSGGAIQIGGANYGMVIGGIVAGSVVNSGVTMINGRIITGTGVVRGNGQVIDGGDGGAEDLLRLEVRLPHGSRLRVHNPGAGHLSVVRGELAALDADITQGTVEASAVGEIEARTAQGSIRIGRITGTARLTTAQGSVTIDRADGPVEARTAQGSITVTGSGPVVARTSQGNVTVHATGQEQDVEARTSMGNITVTAAPGAARPRVRAHSAMGSVSLP
ncbi:DUF4097 family beta strand repeat-containing protein [Marinactinospora thermotolerans]|uniref:DUF4097 family beta strand repeat-containing protein n=1 Tax=Marinactinospora thermotolerans TaxID=531310 RepID=UPI003D8DD808